MPHRGMYASWDVRDGRVVPNVSRLSMRYLSADDLLDFDSYDRSGMSFDQFGKLHSPSHSQIFKSWRGLVSVFHPFFKCHLQILVYLLLEIGPVSRNEILALNLSSNYWRITF